MSMLPIQQTPVAISQRDPAMRCGNTVVRQSLSKSFIPRVQLRLAREMAGWSQIELADRLGIRQVTVSHWETGETTPSPYYCQRLSHLFGKTLDELDLAARNPSSPPAIAPPITHRQEEAIIDPVIPPFVDG